MSEKTIASRGAPSSTPERVEGIGGWLILPLLNLLIMIGVYVVFVARQVLGLLETPAGYWGGNFFKSGEFFLCTFIALTAALAIFAFYCLASFAQRKKRTPRLMIAFFLLVVLQALLNAAGTLFFAEDQNLDAEMNSAIADFARTLLPAAVWIAYFRASKRVKNTFVR